jgi:methylmalonyl-CoA mutase
LKTDFPNISRDDWRKIVEAELKGAPFDERMLTRTAEGIPLRALYTHEDAVPAEHLPPPGFAPYVRGTRTTGFRCVPWEISQEIAASSAGDFNAAARSGLSRGLMALNIVLDRATRNGADPDWAEPAEVGAGGLSLASLADLERALEGIDLGAVPLFIRSGASGMPVAALLTALARKNDMDLGRLRGCIEVDPLGVLSHEGRLPQSLECAFREMAALTRWAKVHAPSIQTICVHSRAWHEAGGHAVQELAFALATALEYLRALDKRGLSVDDVAPRIRFAYTVGSRFFMEIAKLRAARVLWSRLVEALGGSPAAQCASIHVRTSLFNKTLFDPHVNILRTSVEAFAGVLAGCDSMQVGPFDELFREPAEFSQRVARNQQLVLRDECHLTQVADPAGGSWFIEELTQELARRAWALFQEIERHGGMIQSMRAGWPQSEVARVAEERLRNIARRRESIIGTNVYPNPNEAPPEPEAANTAAFHRRRVQQVRDMRTSAEDAQHKVVLERLAQVVNLPDGELFAAAVESIAAGATLGELTRAIRIHDEPDPPIVPVCATRAAAGFERLRRAVARHGTTKGRSLTVFLANVGPPRQHKARADFARGFFEVGGFTVINRVGFKTAAEAASMGVESGADAICLCSTDETYVELVPALIQALRERDSGALVILAGYPRDQVEAHKAAGVDEFIHIRADALEVLSRIAVRRGVNL